MVMLQLSFFRPFSDRVIIIPTFRFLRPWCLPFNGDNGIVCYMTSAGDILYYAVVVRLCSKVDDAIQLVYADGC